MFKFEFKVDEENEKKDATEICDEKETRVDEHSTECYDCYEIKPDVSLIDDLDVCKLNSTELSIGKVNLIYMIPKFVIKDIDSTSNIQKAEQNHTDLIPGIYEGGAKLWECTEDLLIYLESNFSPEDWKTKNVLDLGCGCGLLGIFALRFGSSVHFQDYNEDVLEKITVPNVLLNHYSNNFDMKEISNICKFYSGDWSKYMELTKDEIKFDFILTSETIYNPENQKKLLNIFSKKLKPDGIVLVAAKTYYFGVGGSLRQFEDLVVQDKCFDVKTVWTSNNGVNREIVELRRINDNENK